MTLEENTRTSTRILKAEPFFSMVLKIFPVSRLKSSRDVWPSGYSQRRSGSAALAGPQPAAVAPECCVVLTRAQKNRSPALIFSSLFLKAKQKGVRGTRT